MTERPLRALVTGMGIVSAAGTGLSPFQESLRAGTSAIRSLPKPPHVGAELTGFHFADSLGLEAYDAYRGMALRLGLRAALPVQASIVAALEAWTHARLHEQRLPEDRVGLVIAGNNTTRGYQDAVTPGFQRDPEYLSPRYAVQYQDTDHLGVLSQLVRIHGEGFVSGGASASGGVALVQAKRLVQLGVVDACLVVGVMANLSPMEWQGFLQLGALGGHGFAEAPHQACRPFDALAEGFVYGQAAAAMLLESECSARSRGAEPLAELAGGAVVLHGTASADPSRDGETRAMKGALRDSGLQPKDAVYINTHGTSTPLGDRTELDALVETFGEHFPNLWLNSTKPITGHALTAAGVVEAVATVLQVRQSFLHPHLNLGTPIDARARWVGEKAISVPVPVAMSNSFGFSGINTSVVLRRWPS